MDYQLRDYLIVVEKKETFAITPKHSFRLHQCIAIYAEGYLHGVKKSFPDDVVSMEIIEN